MVEALKSPAPHVVAVQFKGAITSEDVAQAIGLVEAGLEKNDRVSLFYDLTQLEKMTATAFLHDLAYGLKSLGRLYRFQQVAVITDSDKIKKVVEWEDWLFKSLEMKSFPSSEINEALSWVERRPELPEPGFTYENLDTHLSLDFGPQITGYDITRVAELIHDRYEEHGPVRMLVNVEKVPKLGPGFLYEKLRQFKLAGLLDRYAVMGPSSLKMQIKAFNPLFQAQLRYFEPGKKDEAIAWLSDHTPSVVVIPTDREDRFALRLSGKITSKEIEALYSQLLPHLKGDNALDVLLEIPYEDGITLTAIWKSIALGVKNYSKLTQSIRRMALITDSRFLSKATELENLIIPSVEERPFTFNQRHIATAWLDEGRAVAALTTQLPEGETVFTAAAQTKLLTEESD